MKCSIMQPTYNSWLGYYDLVDRVDRFVFLDDVKLEKCSWQVRNRIRTAQGELYLTIPIKKTKSSSKLMINEAVIHDKVPWQKKHLKSIFYAYKKSEFFDEVYPFVEKLIKNRSIKLCDFTVNIITVILDKISITKQIVFSSNLKNLSGKKDTRVALICRKIGCDEYISPRGSAMYIEKDSPGGEFTKKNIALFYQDYEHPTYPQPYAGFVPCMGIFDLLFNCGFDKSLEVIRSGRRKSIDYLSYRKDYLKLKE